MWGLLGTRRSLLRTLLSALLPLALCAGLLGTIYLTLFDWQWIAFLSGVFVAAVLALASRAANAEWRVARRTKQLEKLRAEMAVKAALYKHAEVALADGASLMRRVLDANGMAIVYVDRDERCHQPNMSFAQLLGSGVDAIEGRLLRDVLGEKHYARLRSAVASALAGEETEALIVQQVAGGRIQAYQVKHLPDLDREQRVRGFHAVFTAQAAAVPEAQEVVGATTPSDEVTPPPPSISLDQTGTPVTRSTIDLEEFNSWQDPKTRFLDALRHGHFCLFYQPIAPLVRAQSHPPFYEILVRLKEEENNLLPPGAFLPSAQDAQLTTALDRWVVHALIEWWLTRRAHTRRREVPRCNINLWGETLEDGAFPDYVQAELLAHDIPPASLGFEIDEPDLVRRHSAVARFAAAARTLGCSIVIDGFGSARGSFDALRGIPVDFVKIDSSIVQGLASRPADTARIREINDTAHALGMRTIAEFVESRETIVTLKRLGVDYAQGFGVCVPKALQAASASASRETAA